MITYHPSLLGLSITNAKKDFVILDQVPFQSKIRVYFWSLMNILHAHFNGKNNDFVRSSSFTNLKPPKTHSNTFNLSVHFEVHVQTL